MYILVGLIVIVFAALGYFDRKADKVFFCIEILIMTLMLCFRYGQGTDYFGYEVNYSLVPDNIDINFLLHNKVHGEIGYTFLVEVFKNYGFSFQIFVGVLSLIMMLMTWKGIEGYSKKRTIAVALLFPTYYLTFYFAIRQGLALAITLGAILPAYIRKQKLRYIIWVCLAATVHKSVLVLLIPLLCGKYVMKYKRYFILISVVFGGVLGTFLKMTSFRRGYFVFSPSINAILLRIILFIAITRLYKFSSQKDNINDSIYDLYLIGFCIYIAACSMAFISHRTTAYMKIGEVLLISRLLSERSMTIEYIKSEFILLKQHVYMLTLLICLVEGIKNIESYVGQGEYYEGIHFYNYPYVSVFNKEDIYKYRENEFYDKFEHVFKLER